MLGVLVYYFNLKSDNFKLYTQTQKPLFLKKAAKIFRVFIFY